MKRFLLLGMIALLGGCLSVNVQRGDNSPAATAYRHDWSLCARAVANGLAVPGQTLHYRTLGNGQVQVLTPEQAQQSGGAHSVECHSTVTAADTGAAPRDRKFSISGLITGNGAVINNTNEAGPRFVVLPPQGPAGPLVLKPDTVIRVQLDTVTNTVVQVDTVPGPVRWRTRWRTRTVTDTMLVVPAQRCCATGNMCCVNPRP